MTEPHDTSDAPRASDAAADAHPSFPIAEVRPTAWHSRGRFASSLWLLTGLSVALGVGLIVAGYRSQGPQITVHFEQGHGLQAGDRLRYRGMDVGEVRELHLGPDLRGVDVVVELLAEAAGLARQGSQIWIARPQISLTRMSGLDTVVGPKYLGILPGPSDSPQAFRFVGLESPLQLLEEDLLQIELHFEDGHGLEVGDPLKHRGIVVGEVSQVQLRENLEGVSVQIRLTEPARELARAGSQFWVERPKVNWTGVRGLETLVSGRYVTVRPGDPSAKPQFTFTGMESAPATNTRPAGGLELVLEGDQRLGLEPGAPVMYRGATVGQVLAVGLAADASRVEARIFIQPGYQRLVRDNSRFWSSSGIDVSLGLGGLQLNTGNLETITVGGASFATPTEPGAVVSTGHRFILHRKAEPEWLDWKANILIGDAEIPPGLSLPQPLRVALRWREKVFGLERERQRNGWALLLADGRLCGPADLLTPVIKAVGGRTILEVAGTSVALNRDRLRSDNELATYQLEARPDRLPAGWDLQRIQSLAPPADALVTAGTQELGVALPRSRLTEASQSWTIDAAISIPTDAHGACVVLSHDGALAGFLVVEEGQARVRLVTKALLGS